MKTVPFDRTRLGIITPMANERDTAARFTNAVLAECSQFHFADTRMFVVLDHASTDGTRDIVEGMSLDNSSIIPLWRPHVTCVAEAYKEGYREAILTGCDWILEMDAGFSHQPEEMGRFFEAMSRGAECVFGSRFAKGSRFEGRARIRRRIVSQGGTFLANVLLGTRLSDMTSGFQCFTRHALKDILDRGISSKGRFFQTEIRHHGRHFPHVEVPITYISTSGGSKIPTILEAIIKLLFLSVRDGRFRF